MKLVYAVRMVICTVLRPNHGLRLDVRECNNFPGSTAAYGETGEIIASTGRPASSICQTIGIYLLWAWDGILLVVLLAVELQ